MSETAHRKAQTSTSGLSVPHKSVPIVGGKRSTNPATPYQHQRSFTPSFNHSPSYGSQKNSSTGRQPFNRSSDSRSRKG